MLEKAVCLHTLHEEIRGMGNWKRAELRLLKAKMDPFRQWGTCSISSIFCRALTEKQPPDGTEMWSLITAAVKTKCVAPTTTACNSSCSFS